LIETKYKRSRPDAWREREHSDGREAGVLQQLADGEYQIVHGTLSVVTRQRSKSRGSALCGPRFAASFGFGIWNFHSYRSASIGSTLAARRDAN